MHIHQWNSYWYSWSGCDTRWNSQNTYTTLSDLDGRDAGMWVQPGLAINKIASGVESTDSTKVEYPLKISL